MNDAKLIGQGVRFPPGVDEQGRWAWSSGADNVRESIRIILQTDPQERLMEPAFGGGLRRFLFRPNVASTHRLIQESIVQALARWERRIQLDAVEVSEDPDDANAARAVLRYRVIANGARDQLSLQVPLA